MHTSGQTHIRIRSDLLWDFKTPFPSLMTFRSVGMSPFLCFCVTDVWPWTSLCWLNICKHLRSLYSFKRVKIAAAAAAAQLLVWKSLSCLVLISLLSCTMNCPQLQNVSLTAICFLWGTPRIVASKKGLSREKQTWQNDSTTIGCYNQLPLYVVHTSRFCSWEQLQRIRHKDKLWRLFQSCYKGNAFLSSVVM